MNFRVWAPQAGAVSLGLDTQTLRMMRDEKAKGWWHVEAEASAGALYRFMLDDGEQLADPRSLSQPEGVFGPSAVVDHAAFAWHDAGWQPPPLDSAVIYEMHVGSFTPDGTFDSAIARLDHLTALGITHVEIMPVNEFTGSRGWGYDGVFLWAPHHRYGGPEGLKRLVDACHARGLAVLLDVVYNHFGPEGNVVHRYGPYTTDQYQTPWGPAVNLDQPGSDEVRRFFCDNALMWLRDYHCDGLRLDAVHPLYDRSAIPFLEQLATETRALSAHLGRLLVLIAESNLNDPRMVRSQDAGGFGITAQWNDDFHHAVHVALTGEQMGYYVDFTPLHDLARSLQRGYVYEGQYSRFRDRMHGRPASLSGQQLVASLQNHDQVGNRADGARLSQIMPLRRCQAAATLLLTSPFIPLLFQGEEWGASTPFPYFCDHKDPELARAVSEGRKKEFAEFADADAVPDPEDARTGASATLCWDESTRGDHAELLAWYRALIAVRRAEPDLRDGRLDRCKVQYDEASGWIIVSRGRVQIGCNLGTHPQRVPLECVSTARVLAQSGEVTLEPGALMLGPDASVVLRR
ncbi:MAG: malto-oligosyltrehalose trehalohydrolase [Gemmatimonadales bacterium]